MKSSRTIETERAAEAAIESLRNRSAAEFVAELNVVLADFPGDAVDVVPVRIDAAGEGRRCLHDGERAANRNFRESEVVLVGVRRARCDAIQCDRGWIEAAILREETFGEAVPAEAGFVDNGRRNGSDVGNGNELDASRLAVL